MKIKNLNLHLENFKPNAKRVLKAIPGAVLIASLALTPVSAQAAVSNNDITGDAYIAEDRTNIKAQDGYDIATYFDGYDEYGCTTVTLEDLRKAIEMSDTLGVVNGFVTDGINTTKQEVLGLNIYDLYNDYQYNPTQFAYDHVEDRSAIDAYLTFGTHTVSTLIKEEIARDIASLVVEQGLNLTMYPTVIVNENEVSCIVGVNGETQKYTLHGETIEDIKYQCSTMDFHYNKAICSISGTSDQYENTFAYNGVRTSTNESVWLSLENSEIKQELRSAIDFAEAISERESLEFTTPDPFAYYTLTYDEALELRNQGFNISDLYNVRVQDIYVNNVPKLQR